MTPTAGDKSPKSIANQCCKYFPFAMQQIISLTRKGKTPESVCVCVGEGENAREKYIYEIMHNLFYFVYNLKSVNFFAATFHKNI